MRGHVAEFISERDGFACDMEDVFLTDGASAGVVKILQCLIRDEKDGVRAPFALLCRSHEMIYHVRVRVPCACAVCVCGAPCVCVCGGADPDPHPAVPALLCHHSDARRHPAQVLPRTHRSYYIYCFYFPLL